MADKYCEHSVYGNASFNGSLTNASTTLTVNSVTSGRITVGMHITGSGINDGSYISSFVTGTGGTGTYILTRPATATTTSAMLGDGGGNEAVPPVWGVPVEGDGTSKDPATSSATVVCSLAGATAAAGATITILGAVLTCVASGATANQFNAGSGATLVANIVAAINRSTNTATVAAQAAGWFTPKIQDAVYARQGGTATDLEIMTRAGSATYNGSIVATSGFTGGTFGPWAFSGGTSGCWGCFINGGSPGTLWASGIARAGYGMQGALPTLAGTLAPGDRVFLRADRIIYVGGSLANTITSASMGTATSPVRFIVDDGTVWASPANPVLRIVSHATSTNYVTIGFVSNTTFAFLEGKKYSDGTYSLKIENSAAANAPFYISAGGPCRIMNIDASSTVGAPIALHVSGGYVAGIRGLFKGIKIATSRNANSFVYNVTNNPYAVAFEDIEFDNTGSSAPNLTPQVLSGSGSLFWRFKNLKLTGFVVGSHLLTPGANLEGGSGIRGYSFEDVDFGGVTLRGPYLGSVTPAVSKLDMVMTAATIVNSGGYKDFSIDTLYGYCAWNPTISQPTCTSMLEDGTSYSVMVIPSSAGNCNVFNPFTLPKLAKVNSLADGDRTFTIEFIAEETLVPSRANLGVQFSYVAVDGTVVRIDTFDIEGAAWGASTTTWSNEAGGFVVFQNGGAINHKKYKIVINTLAGKPLKTGTEVNATISLYHSVANTTKTYFFDWSVAIA